MITELKFLLRRKTAYHRRRRYFLGILNHPIFILVRTYTMVHKRLYKKGKWNYWDLTNKQLKKTGEAKTHVGFILLKNWRGKCPLTHARLRSWLMVCNIVKYGLVEKTCKTFLNPTFRQSRFRMLIRIFLSKPETKTIHTT